MSDNSNILKHPKGRELLSAWKALSGEALLKAVLKERSLKVAVSSSFGTESAVLLDMVASINPATPVITVDTGRLFAETIAYREALTKHLDLLDVRVVRPAESLVANMDPDGMLYQSNPDACCQARKVMPYAMAVAGFDILITGRKRYHGDVRQDLDVVDLSGAHVKVNPLVHFSATDIEATLNSRKLPRHPLAEAGYPSIGCQPCTHMSCPSKGVRSGRWSGHKKTECGIHTSFDFKLQSLGG
jgi:phosphoadenosine phosphosulfate reductase